MRIALIGYGKMGKEIEKIALQRGHEISFRIIKDEAPSFQDIQKHNTDVAIEFTEPEAAEKHLLHCLQAQVPVVCGTTGWTARKAEIEALFKAQGGSFFYASNFSVGVNIFFQINEKLAQLMQAYPQYEVSMEEIHHTEKKDAPSGTAITLAEGILANLPRKKQWVNDTSQDADTLGIVSQRLPHVPGTHSIRYESAQDFITIAHEAKNREGFALGAVLAAEFIAARQGVFGMKDLLAL